MQKLWTKQMFHENEGAGAGAQIFLHSIKCSIRL